MLAWEEEMHGLRLSRDWYRADKPFDLQRHTAGAKYQQFGASCQWNSRL